MCATCLCRISRGRSYTASQMAGRARTKTLPSPGTWGLPTCSAPALAVLAAQRGIVGHRRVRGSPWGGQRFRPQGEDLQGALVVMLPYLNACLALPVVMLPYTWIDVNRMFGRKMHCTTYPGGNCMWLSTCAMHSMHCSTWAMQDICYCTGTVYRYTFGCVTTRK